MNYFQLLVGANIGLRKMSKFWDKFDTCLHEPYENYGVHVHCGNEELGCSGGFEWHCKHCNAFITEDPCGCVAGISGWSSRRWKDYYGKT